MALSLPPIFLAKLLYGEPGLKVFKKSILKYCGLKPTKITKIDPVFKSTEKSRKNG